MVSGACELLVYQDTLGSCATQSPYITFRVSNKQCFSFQVVWQTFLLVVAITGCGHVDVKIGAAAICRPCECFTSI